MDTLKRRGKKAVHAGNPEDWVVEVRRELHAEPELAFREEKTARRIVLVLESLGIEVETGLAKTGVSGLIRGESPGRTVALRADIDALPMDEKNDFAYRSRSAGVMHACGHDAHTAILLGAAKRMAEKNFCRKIKGNIKFIFQPGEEGAAGKINIPGFKNVDTGAGIMIAQGVLENPGVDMVFACHVSNELDCGEVGLFEKTASASADRVRMVIRGKGCHAANPDKGSDAIVAASYFVTQLQTVVSRNVPPTGGAVVSIGVFKGGTSGNVLPEEVVLEGTVRAFNEDVRQLVKTRVIDIALTLEKVFCLDNVSCEYIDGCPPCVNRPEALAVLNPAAEKAVGAGRVKWVKPGMLAEDFAYFAREVPAALFMLGTGNRKKGITRDLHSPFFDIDEKALAHGVDIMVKTVEEFFAV